MSESLADRQKRFPVLVAKLIIWCDIQGYQLSFGEAYRTPEQAAMNAKNGSGIKNSLHTMRLAVDFNLFIKGVYQTDSLAYKKMGEYWKSLDKDCAWGGDFSKPDGNHLSLSWDGIK